MLFLHKASGLFNTKKVLGFICKQSRKRYWNFSNQNTATAYQKLIPDEVLCPCDTRIFAWFWYGCWRRRRRRRNLVSTWSPQLVFHRPHQPEKLLNGVYIRESWAQPNRLSDLSVSYTLILKFLGHCRYDKTQFLMEASSVASQDSLINTWPCCLKILRILSCEFLIYFLIM